MMKEGGMYYLEKGFKFPENYTLEFDVIPVPLNEETQAGHFDMTLFSTDEEGLYPSMYVPGKSGVVFNLSTPNGQHTFSAYNAGEYGVSGDYNKEAGLLKMSEVNHVSLWVQKSRFRLYLHGEKIFDVPKAFQPGQQYDQIRFFTFDDSYPLVTNIRIADAGADTRSKLLTEGKMVTRGITFDTGSDVIKPTSYGVLKEIATVLKDNPAVRVKIIGHTDSDGDDQPNLVLSQKRAAAVKNALAKEFAIDASRMETDGKGEKEPASPNTTAEGKANNRRVEFIKL
jgi:outer membrane protein OmpA-like peptidoglycan-associated protein